MPAPKKIQHTKQDTTDFLFVDGDKIEANIEAFTMNCRPTDQNSCQLEDLKQQKLISSITCYIGHDTYFIQVPTNAKTSLCKAERQDVNYIRAPARGRPLQLPLFLHEGLLLSAARLNFAPLGPTPLQKPIQELVKKLERNDVIPTNNNCRAEATQTLTYYRSRSSGRQNIIHKIFEKATGITTKTCPEVLATNFVKPVLNADSSRKVHCSGKSLIFTHTCITK